MWTNGRADGRYICLNEMMILRSLAFVVLGILMEEIILCQVHTSANHLDQQERKTRARDVVTIRRRDGSMLIFLTSLFPPPPSPLSWLRIKFNGKAVAHAGSSCDWDG